MAWSNSKVFVSFVQGALDRTTAFDVDTDSILVALYNNTGTPSNTVTLANSAYNVDQWVVANEVSSAGQWAAGGVALASKTLTTASNVVTFDAADTASGPTATLSNVYGCLVYDNTLAGKYGQSYNYLGGANSVVSGTFTVVWASTGIMTFTV